jgi:hypothetical protein
MDHYIKISLCVDNAAFGDTYNEQAAEVARILRYAADQLQDDTRYLDPYSGVDLCLNDVNGNRVGFITPEVLAIS